MKTRINSYLTSTKGQSGLTIILVQMHEKGKESQRFVFIRLKKSAPISIHNLGARELDSHNYL